MTIYKQQLDGQFVLTRDINQIPESWRVCRKENWMLAAHPTLPLTDVVTPDGESVGWIIGYPITSEGDFVPPRLIFDPACYSDSPDSASAFVHSLSGRFAAVMMWGHIRRLYLDSGGTLAAVYALDLPVAASTVSLIETGHDDWDHDLQVLLGMPESDLWYPAGLTPRTTIRRLLPNHYLDLDQWKPVRHWPIESHFAVERTFDESVARIVELIKKNIFAVGKRYPLQLSLTAGRDTRMILACSRSMLDRIKFHTGVWIPSGMDSQVAYHIARHFRLNHVTYRIEMATEEQLADWQVRVGHCVSGEMWRIHPTSRKFDAHRAYLPGVAGEVGRGYYWREGDAKGSEITAEEILRRTKLPAEGKVLEMMETWLSEVRHLPWHTILDLVYIEQRLGCWAGPLQYGQDGMNAIRIAPLNDREIYRTILHMPTEPRRRLALPEEICRQEWPELLAFPFNRLTGTAKVIQAMRSAAYRLAPSRTRRFYNQFFAWKFQAC
jgi:hypothetical protein